MKSFKKFYNVQSESLSNEFSVFGADTVQLPQDRIILNLDISIWHLHRNTEEAFSHKEFYTQDNPEEQARKTFIIDKNFDEWQKGVGFKSLRAVVGEYFMRAEPTAQTDSNLLYLQETILPDINSCVLTLMGFLGPNSSKYIENIKNNPINHLNSSTANQLIAREYPILYNNIRFVGYRDEKNLDAKECIMVEKATINGVTYEKGYDENLRQRIYDGIIKNSSSEDIELGLKFVRYRYSSFSSDYWITRLKTS